MRRRRHGGRSLTADEVIALGETAVAGFERSDPARARRLQERLGEHGYTPLDLCRARYWIRQGRPDDYRWDQWRL